jgi:hypothetical protein
VKIGVRELFSTAKKNWGKNWGQRTIFGTEQKNFLLGGENSSLTPIFPPIFSYLSKHFRGNLSLALSFWINFIVLAGVLYWAGAQLRDTAAADARYLNTLLAFLVVNILIYSWQVCGVWRASERAFREHAWFLWVRGAQVIVMLSVLVIFKQIFGYVHLTVQETPMHADGDDTPAYALDLSPDGTVVALRGEIDFGITRDLARLFENHDSIEVVTLDSPGGLVAEARGLAMLITRRGLTTYTEAACISACTHVFVSGERRYLGPRGRLGFHSYRLDSPYASLFMDPIAEQRRDMAFFRSRNIDEHFLERIVSTPNSTIWYPSHEQLLDAGIVHEVKPGKLGSENYFLHGTEEPIFVERK